MRNWEKVHSVLTFFGFRVWKKQLPFERAMGKSAPLRFWRNECTEKIEDCAFADNSSP